MLSGIDFIGVSASFIVHDAQGRVLLQKRGHGARDERGRWDVGGGAIEFNETINDAVRREVKEELKTTPLDIRFLNVYDAHRTLPNGTPTHWVTVMHAVLVDPDTISIGEPGKIAEVGWFTSDNLPEPLHSQFWKSYQPALERGLVK